MDRSFDTPDFSNESELDERLEVDYSTPKFFEEPIEDKIENKTSYEKPNLFFDNEFSIDTFPDGRILANENNFLTSRKKFFSCGDSRRGQSLVVWAIKEGRDCATSVHKFLKKKQLT